MVASQETLDALEDVGLNMYERKIYAALISRGVSTAGELSEMTGVPRSRSYDVLESLADKGFAILKPSKPMQYVAVPPEEALENKKDLYKEELEEKMDKIDRFKETEAVNELQSLYNEGVDRVEPADMSGAVKGRYNVHKHIGNMIQSAEDEVKIMTTEKGLQNIADNHQDVLEEAAEAGVNVRVAAPVTDENGEAHEQIADAADVRHFDEEHLEHKPEGRFVIVDDDKVAFSLTHDDIHPTQDTVFWSESDHAAEQALGPMFEMVWNSGSQPR
ncbi:MAG: helix-turn-helix domain-containing protein [Candidatus Nanohaloarchaea archaeon]|nr:helix-turn-helix domain-containing protein [Candidatus Nanohaloarchaea archaeon]